MNVITKEIVDSAVQAANDRVGRPDSILMSPKAYDMLIKWQKFENWLRSLGPRREKQERLKIALTKRVGRYKYKMNLPE